MSTKPCGECPYLRNVQSGAFIASHCVCGGVYLLDTTIFIAPGEAPQRVAQRRSTCPLISDDNEPWYEELVGDRGPLTFGTPGYSMRTVDTEVVEVRNLKIRAELEKMVQGLPGVFAPETRIQPTTAKDGTVTFLVTWGGESGPVIPDVRTVPPPPKPGPKNRPTVAAIIIDLDEDEDE